MAYLDKQYILKRTRPEAVTSKDKTKKSPKKEQENPQKLRSKSNPLSGEDRFALT
jgi:hypothetical protein